LGGRPDGNDEKLPRLGLLQISENRSRDTKLERILIGWNHPIYKNTLKINLLEHVLIGKVSQLFRNML
jgi:hypothetical protein